MKLPITLTKPIAFFDIEATGLNISSDRIVSLAIKRVHPYFTTDVHSFLMNPGFPMSQDVIAIHGITNEMVADKPGFDYFAEFIFSILKDCDLAGYNSNNFDVPLLAEEFLRCNINYPSKNTLLVDVGNIFKKKEERTLSAAVAFYTGGNHENAHSAEADVDATLAVFKAQLERYQLQGGVAEISKFSTMDNRVDYAGKIARNEKGEYIYNFSNKKGTLVKDDPGLAEWMLTKDFPRNTLNVVSDVLDEIYGEPDKKFI